MHLSRKLFAEMPGTALLLAVVIAELVGAALAVAANHGPSPSQSSVDATAPSSSSPIRHV